MRVIYIAGTSHSGSTLLDLMLNAHPAIFSAGEVLKLNRQLGIDPPRKSPSARASRIRRPAPVARRRFGNARSGRASMRAPARPLASR